MSGTKRCTEDADARASLSFSTARKFIETCSVAKGDLARFVEIYRAMNFYVFRGEAAYFDEYLRRTERKRGTGVVGERLNRSEGPM